MSECWRVQKKKTASPLSALRLQVPLYLHKHLSILFPLRLHTTATPHYLCFPESNEVWKNESTSSGILSVKKEKVMEYSLRAFLALYLFHRQQQFSPADHLKNYFCFNKAAPSSFFFFFLHTPNPISSSQKRSKDSSSIKNHTSVKTQSG